MARYDFLQFVWLNLASFVKSVTYWNYYEKFGAFGFSESRLLHRYLSINNSIKLLTGVKLKALLGMQTEITESTLAISRSSGAIPHLSCWTEHKQLYGTNPTETNIRSWQPFTTTYHVNFKTKKHLLFKNLSVGRISVKMWCYFSFLYMLKHVKQGSKLKKKKHTTPHNFALSWSIIFTAWWNTATPGDTCTLVFLGSKP